MKAVIDRESQNVHLIICAAMSYIYIFIGSIMSCNENVWSAYDLAPFNLFFFNRCLTIRVKNRKINVTLSTCTSFETCNGNAHSQVIILYSLYIVIQYDIILFPLVDIFYLFSCMALIVSSMTKLFVQSVASLKKFNILNEFNCFYSLFLVAIFL